MRKMWLLTSGAVIALALTGCGRDFEYKMPTGAICKYRLYQDTRVEFYECTDGRRYVEPEYYNEVRR